MPQPSAQTDALPRDSSACPTRPCPVQSCFYALGLPEPCSWQPRSRLHTLGLLESPKPRRPVGDNSDPYLAASHHSSSSHHRFTLSMILTSLTRATCSAHGETRVEMTHKDLPPTQVLWAGLHQREDAIREPELAKADRASSRPTLLHGLCPAADPRCCALQISRCPYLEDATPHLFLTQHFRLS